MLQINEAQTRKQLIDPAQDRLGWLPQTQRHIFSLEDGKNHLLKVVSELSKAFALVVLYEETMHIRKAGG